MAKLAEKIAAVIREKLKSADADLETLPNGHVCGHVIASEFRGKSYEARYKRVRELLKQALDPGEFVRVSTLLTYTPKEWFAAPEEQRWEINRAKLALRRVKRTGARHHLRIGRPRGGKCVLKSVSRRIDNKGRVLIVVAFRDRNTDDEYRAEFAPDEFLNDEVLRKRLNDKWDPDDRPNRKTGTNGKQRRR